MPKTFIDESGEEEEFVDAGSSSEGMSEGAESDNDKAKAAATGKAKSPPAKAPASAKKATKGAAAAAPASASKSKGKGKAAAPKTPTPAKSSAKSAARSPAAAKSAGAASGGAAGGGGGGGGSGSGSGPTDPKEAVVRYMRQTNRPYSVINIFDNLHKKVPKALVQKLVDQLVADGRLCAQEYGKAKIYYYSQAKLEAEMGSVSAAALSRLTAEAKTLTADLLAAEAQARAADGRAASLAAQPADSELDAGLAAGEAEAAALGERLSGVKRALADAGAGATRPDALKHARQEFNKYRGMWSERRQNVTALLEEMASEGSTRLPELQDKLGVEADAGKIPERMPA